MEFSDLFNNRSASMPIPVAERYKMRGCGRSLAGIVDSNPAWGIDVCL